MSLVKSLIIYNYPVTNHVKSNEMIEDVRTYFTGRGRKEQEAQQQLCDDKDERSSVLVN